MVGANVYLTPPGTQGFAPHWDDVDAFILQLEGKKHWRIYELQDKEKLPIFSSKNLTQDEIGDPCLEATLEAGDMLYVYIKVNVGRKGILYVRVSPQKGHLIWQTGEGHGIMLNVS